MRKIKLHIIILLGVCLNVEGQNVPDSARINLGFPVYSQYLQNGLVLNPAYAGTRGVQDTMDGDKRISFTAVCFISRTNEE
jgi:hypothetical protein